MQTQGHITDAASGTQLTTKVGSVHTLQAQGWVHV
jgi:hypothetical protein